ncbi:MAG: Phage portal protein lambda family, partial [Verrucomicrobiota bacterium]
MTTLTKAQQAAAEHKAARMAYETARYTRAAAILAKYDATEPNRLRRQPTRETQSEGELYNMSKRLLGCNLGRDLERNYSPAKSMLHQFRVNVVGSLGKLRVNTEDGDEATAWFNEVWSKDCDFRDECDFSTMLQNILVSEIREGDALCVIDDGLIEDSGKMLTWESDQIAPVSEQILATSERASDYRSALQDNGILRGPFGQVLGYCTTGKRGMTVIEDEKDVTIWKRGQARLAKNPWRLNQGRGIGSLITTSTNLIDLYEMLASELGSAKRAAKQYAFVKRDNAVTDWDSPASAPEFLPENDGRTSTDVALDGANQSTHTAKNYDKLDAFTGGLMDYLDPKDTVEFPKLDHPNSALAPFLEAVHGYSGAALGLARAYTILRADSSYTAFRGDMIMTWVTFYWLQKHIERTVADWTAIRVLNWAQRRRIIKPLSVKWERAISWTWPTMPEVNELDAQNAIAAALKNGTTDWSELLGPDWKKRLQALADQTEFVRENNLPLSILETASGGTAGDPMRDESAADEA